VSVAEEAVRALEAAGCKVDVMDHVMDEDPFDLWVSEFYAGAGTRLRRHLEEERELLDSAIAAVLDQALAQSLQEYYTKVFKRYDFRETMRTFFESIDLLATPTGQPAASVPAGFTAAGLPVGLQFVAKINHETDLFRAAAALESVRPWAGKRPGGAMAHAPSGQPHPPQLPQKRIEHRVEPPPHRIQRRTARCPDQSPGQHVADVVLAHVDTRERHYTGKKQRPDTGSPRQKHQHRGDGEAERGVVAGERRVAGGV
jgi:Amidase